jgi:hypothetical protein
VEPNTQEEISNVAMRPKASSPHAFRALNALFWGGKTSASLAPSAGVMIATTLLGIA